MKKLQVLIILLGLFSCTDSNRIKPSGLYEFVSPSGEARSINFSSDSTAIVSINGLSTCVKYRVEKKSVVLINVLSLGDITVDITKDGLRTSNGELYTNKSFGTTSNTGSISNQPSSTINKSGSSSSESKENKTAAQLIGGIYIGYTNIDSRRYTYPSQQKITTEKLNFLSENSVKIVASDQFGVYINETGTYSIEGDYVIINYNGGHRKCQIISNGEQLKCILYPNSIVDDILYIKQN